MSKQSRYSLLPTPPKLSEWFNSKRGCITVIAASWAFIAIFIANIVLNHAWLNLVFIAAYGAVIMNRLKRLRELP